MHDATEGIRVLVDSSQATPRYPIVGFEQPLYPQDALTVELETDTEHPMGARMLGTHVELHPFGFGLVLRPEDRVLLGPGAEWLLCDPCLSHGSRQAPTLQASGR